MDQNDSMLSSPTSSEDETFDDDSVFHNTGANAGSSHTGNTYVQPQTPQNDHLNASAPGELSPPRSQTQSTTSNTANNANVGDGSMEDDEGVDMPSASGSGGAGAGGQQTQESQAAEEAKPGAGWKNRKAQDEMQKTWDHHIVDKDFSLREFGDVMAHRRH